MKRYKDETDNEYIERLESDYDTFAQYIQHLEYTWDAYTSGMAKLDQPMSKEPRGGKMFAKSDVEIAVWEEKTAAMHHAADAAQAYDLRLRLETAKIKTQLLEAYIVTLEGELARWEHDPELAKTIITADYMHDREQQAKEERSKGGQKTGRKTTADAIKNRELAEAAYAEVRNIAPGAKLAAAYLKYIEAAKNARLTPWGKKHFISQVKSASA